MNRAWKASRKMSVIAIKGIPLKWSLISTVKYFKKIIPGSFEALNFGHIKQFDKTVFIGLSEFLDPARVIELVHNATIRPKLKLLAYVPKSVPDIALARRKPKLRLPKPSKRANLEYESPYEVIQITHHELLMEIQYKYPGLYNLSRKTGHKLLEEIAKIIFERVKDIMSLNIETRENCFKLSGHYRKLHPHGNDFELIMETLHALQDKSGAPHSQIQEKDILQQPVKPYTIDNVPIEAIKSASNKYSERILLAIAGHVQSLDSQIAGDSSEDVARKKVREEMKKILPYMPSVVKQVVAKHFMPQQAPLHRIRIYGEPFLPPKDAMSPFVQRYHAGASRVIRHPRMYNLLMFKIPHKQYAQLMAMDGTVVTGAKLVIRSDNPVYTASAELRSEMAAALGGPRDAPPLEIQDDYDYDFDGQRMEA